MRMRDWIAAAVLAGIGSACPAGGGPARGTDVAAATADAGGLELRLLPDAVVLEPGVPDFSSRDPSPDAAMEPATLDTGGVGANDAVVAPADGWSDAPLAADNGFSTSDAAPADSASIPDHPADVSPDQGCGPGAEPCPRGYSCLPDKNHILGCRFVAECSEKWAVSVDDVFEIGMNWNSLYVKVKARVWPGPSACSLSPCAPDRPCCNTCFAPLYIGSKKFPILVLGEGLAIGCQGTECDPALACEPMKPDVWYWIWGTLAIFGNEPQFFVDSFCPVPPD